MLKEFSTLLIFGITGVIIGLLFDIFRVMRKSFKTPNIITYIQDVLFWILTGCLILYVIYNFTIGEIRLYMILMIIMGALIYFVTISKYFIKINFKIIMSCKSIIILIIRPFCKLFDVLRNSYKKHKLKILKIFSKKDGK